MKDHIRFIINPKSGTGKNKNLENLIRKKFSAIGIEFDLYTTEYPGHLQELTEEAVNKNYSAVAVSGGDGTVHEAVQALTSSNTSLAVIPAGSGNGFANHFNIPHDAERALELIVRKKTETIDTFKIGSDICAATAGLGFDAHIAHQFAGFGKRGFMTYIEIVIRNFFSYKEKKYSFSIDGKPLERNAFLVTLANTSEYGNNVTIAPLANPKDGLIELCVLRKVPLLKILFIAPSLFNASIHRSSYYERFSGRKIIFTLPDPSAIHIDGEPSVISGELIAEVLPGSLKIIVP